MAIRHQTQWFVVFLGALAGLPPLSIDIGVPGFPDMQADLGVGAREAAQTLSLFLLGFAIGPLLLGPMADNLGRRSMLMLGLLIFALASIGCALAGSIETMMLARLLQGVGAGAGGTFPFVIVRDLFDETQARVRISAITVVLSMAPIVAPILGAGILLLAGWRTIYASLGVTGLVLLAVTAAVFRESASPQNRKPLSVTHILSSYRCVLSTRVFMGNALINGCAFAMMLAYIAGSPAILMENFGFSEASFSLVLLTTGTVMMLASMLSSVLSARRVSGQRIVATAGAVSIASSALLLVLTVVGNPGPFTLIILVASCLFGYGLAAPSVIQAALQPVGHMAGTATATLRAMQMICGAVAGAATGILYDGATPVALAFVMTCFAVLGSAAQLLAIERTA